MYNFANGCKHPLLTFINSITMRNFTLSLILLLTASIAIAQRYDYSQVASQITAGATSDYEKAQAIYEFLIDNIAYDTDYKIHHADEVWDNRKGICEGYCNLFTALADCVGLQAVKVTGSSKDPLGKVTVNNHAWLIVATERGPILIDATWGAGSVDKEKGIFTRGNHKMGWFDVEPRVMETSHLPLNPEHQLLDNPVSMEQFEKITFIDPDEYSSLKKCGMDVEPLIRTAYDGMSLVKTHDIDKSKLTPVEIPLSGSLRVGQHYRFRLRASHDTNFALLCHEGDNMRWTYPDKWSFSGNEFAIDYLVPCGGNLELLEFIPKENHYSPIAVYEVAPPTDDDYARLSATDPWLHPGIQKVKGVNIDWIKSQAFNIDAILAELRSGKVAEMPFVVATEHIQIMEMPLSATLRAGQKCRFKVKAPAGARFALICGPKDDVVWTFDEEWRREGNVYVIDYTVPCAGEVRLSEYVPEKGNYWPRVIYNQK